MRVSDVLIGADPELFVLKNGSFISGHTFPCGTKENPRKTEFGAVQVDGLALEFNVRPSATKAEFVSNLQHVLKDLNAIVDEVDPGCILVAQPVAPFSMEFLNALPEHVKELGCNPDFSAYSMSENVPPNADTPFRTGSGHVHVGWTNGVLDGDIDHFIECASIVKQLDYYVGLHSLSFDPDSQRRELYGKAGCFRPKSYGVEYRTLSNKWVGDERLQGDVYDAVMRGLRAWEAGNILEDRYPGFAEHAINTSDTAWMKSDAGRAIEGAIYA